MSENGHTVSFVDRQDTTMRKDVKNRILKVTKALPRKPAAPIQVRRRKTYRRRTVHRNPRPTSSPRIQSSSSSSSSNFVIPLAILPNIHAFPNELSEVTAQVDDVISTKCSNDTTVLENCSICMDEILCKDVVNVSCGHLFHQKCIGSWAKTSRSQNCPLCRTSYISVNSEHVENFKTYSPKKVTTGSDLEKRISRNIVEIDQWINAIDLTV